jgi:hypothetical protein
MNALAAILSGDSTRRARSLGWRSPHRLSERGAMRLPGTDRAAEMFRQASPGISFAQLDGGA